MRERLIVGIDVGGTYTDAALMERMGEDARVLSFSKQRTDVEDLAGSIVAAFEALFEATPDCAPPGVERVVVSTTLCANVVISGGCEPVAVVIMPGPGLPVEDLREMAGIDGDMFGLVEMRGYVDHRGREVEPVDPAEAERVLRRLRSAGYRNLAIAGKFSVRNPSLERQIASMAWTMGGFEHITLGHNLSGALNFPRRMATACLNSAVASTFNNFVSALGRAFAERGVSCPIVILKADGGTMDVDTASAMPVKSILSGPAASVAGSLALAPARGAGVTIDIGGTTTDVSFFVEGAPLFEAKGAEIAGRKTLVRAVYSRSLALGGDTLVSPVAPGVCGAVLTGGSREGVAAAFGGLSATLTDALIVAGFAEAGDPSRSRMAVEREAKCSGITGPELAKLAVEQAIERIAAFVKGLLAELGRRPVYTVREAISPVALEPRTIVGIGAPAPAVIPLLASRLGARPVAPDLAAVGNAIGAALAVPTAEATLRIDTAAGFVTSVEDGLREDTGGRVVREQEAVDIASRFVLSRAPWAKAEDVEVVEMESFNVVRDFHTIGRIFDVKAQVRPRSRRLYVCGEGAEPLV